MLGRYKESHHTLIKENKWIHLICRRQDKAAKKSIALRSYIPETHRKSNEKDSIFNNKK